jgi:uncharacterized protein YfiM (DUF2279 family)
MLLAVASRETNMQDIVGDSGHGRGLFQIDDRFHADWLAKHGARGGGTTPRIKDAAQSAAAMLATNASYAEQKGIGSDQVIRFAASAYNAGCGGAFAGFQARDCDKKTTGGDYGTDVLERLAAIKGRNGGGETRGSPRAASSSGSRRTASRSSTRTPGSWSTPPQTRSRPSRETRTTTARTRVTRCARAFAATRTSTSS